MVGKNLEGRSLGVWGVGGRLSERNEEKTN